jgi:hypothetical protein
VNGIILAALQQAAADTVFAPLFRNDSRKITNQFAFW